MRFGFNTAMRNRLQKIFVPFKHSSSYSLSPYGSCLNFQNILRTQMFYMSVYESHNTILGSYDRTDLALASVNTCLNFEENENSICYAG